MSAESDGSLHHTSFVMIECYLDTQIWHLIGLVKQDWAVDTTAGYSGKTPSKCVCANQYYYRVEGVCQSIEGGDGWRHTFRVSAKYGLDMQIWHLNDLAERGWAQ